MKSIHGAYSMDRDLRAAAKREAFVSSLWTDFVIYGLVAGAMGGAALLARGYEVYAAALAASGAGFALLSLVVTYLRHRRRFLALYLREWNARLGLVRDEELVRLASRLEALGTQEGSTQIRQLKTAFAGFRAILGRKFDASELTYQRYDLILENLFLSALDNLERAAETLEAAAAAEAASDARFDPRQRGPSPGALRQSCEDMLRRNGEVLAALEKAALEMSQVETRRGRARIELEAALAELSRMIDNVHRYAFADT